MPCILAINAILSILYGNILAFLGTPIIIEARSKKTRDLSEAGETFDSEAINKDNDVKS